LEPPQASVDYRHRVSAPGGILAPVRRRSRHASEPSLREALAAGWHELALYLGAGVVYVGIGVAAPEFMFSWIVAAPYLLLGVVLLPALVRRLRR
jgi:hypothetical protein